MHYAIIFSFVVMPGLALAYLDPGTGSYIFQMVLAFFVGASFAVKIYWRKIRAFFGRVFLRQKDEVKENQNEK
ncbi:hypothetical protein IIA95_03955 [Patescibacteria group bacterium]|nr:hypothetical protein [Patescibacteria group bacterium]